VKLNVERETEYALNEILRRQASRKKSEGETLTFNTQLPAQQVEVWDIRASQ